MDIQVGCSLQLKAMQSACTMGFVSHVLALRQYFIFSYARPGKPGEGGTQLYARLKIR